MRAALGPIETRAAEHPPLGASGGKIDAELRQEFHARRRDLACFVAEHDEIVRDHGVGNAGAERAGEMIVAGAGLAHRIVELGPGLKTRRPVALLGGHALTATELAHAAGVSPQTTSGHLGKLFTARLVV
ncbi:MAG: winged helix-turn-helix domain-containing protein, partial [Xanthobacteraceae bacterium]